MPKITVYITGTDQYDHGKHKIDHGYGSIADDPSNLKETINSYKTYLKALRLSWVTITEIDVTTGVGTLLFHEANPLKERTELNVKAKELKINKSKSKSTWGLTSQMFIEPQVGVAYDWDGPSVSFVSAAPPPPAAPEPAATPTVTPDLNVYQGDELLIGNIMYRWDSIIDRYYAHHFVSPNTPVPQQVQF